MVCAVMMSMPSMLVRSTPQMRVNSVSKSRRGAFFAGDFFFFLGFAITAAAVIAKPRKKKKSPAKNAPRLDLETELTRICGVDLTSIDGIDIMTAQTIVARSEERRVGKECRSRWSPYH